MPTFFAYRPMEFELKAKDLATIIFSAAFNPDQKYMLRVMAANKIFDGFGKPLRSSSTTFRTKALPSYFAGPEPPSVAAFSSSSSAVSSGMLKTWPLVARGKDVVSPSWAGNRPAEMQCTSVTEANIADVLFARLMGRSVKTASLERISSSAVTQRVKAPMTDELSVVGCPEVSKLLQGSLTGSKHSGMFHVVKYRGLAQHTVVVSNMSAVFIPATDGRNQITAWVTDATGADVANALFRLYSLPKYASRGTVSDVSLLGKGVTGKDGVATVQFGKQDAEFRLVALVTHVDTGGVAFDPEVPIPVGVRAAQWKVRMHTDRGLYKPGDAVHIKVVARVRSGSARNGDGGRLVVPTPSPQSQFFLRVQWKSRDLPTYVPVKLSTDFGTADLKLNVPMDVDFGGLSLQLVRSTKPNQYEYLPRGESILIADPRPPTVTMDLSLHSAVDADKPTGLLVVPSGTKSRVGVRVVTKTQTGALVENATVVVVWKLIRGAGVPKVADEAPFKPKPRCSVYGLDPALLDRPAQPIVFRDSRVSSSNSGKATTGEFTIVTGSGGVGRVPFDLASALSKESHAPAQVGDSLEVTARWIGPTREVVQEKKSVPVADSPYALGLSLSINDPLPGIHFGIRVDMRAVPDAVKNAGASAVAENKVKDEKFTLLMYKWTQATAEAFGSAVATHDTSLQANLLNSLSASQRVNHTCGQLVNDFGETAQCDGKLQLPSIGQYLLVVQNKPTVGGERVAAALLVGRSAASWQAEPLRALTPGLGVTADRPKYAEGDVATLTFVSPFVGTASMMIVWGNSVSGAASGRKKLRLTGAGKHTVAIKLGAECRGGCVANTIVTAPAQSASVELPVPVPLSKLLQTAISRTILMRTTLVVADPDIPAVSPKVTISFPGGSQSGFVLGPGETTDLQVEVDMKAFSGGKAELMLYATDQAFLDLKPHALPGLAPSFTLDASSNGNARHVADTRRYSASAVGLQSTITTFKRRFAVDPWICPDSFPLRPDQTTGRRSSVLSKNCVYLTSGPRNGIPEVDEMDASYFGRRETELTEFPRVFNPSFGGVMEDGVAGVAGGGGGMQRAPSATIAGGAKGSSPSSMSTAAPRVKLRTNVETTPLFVGSVKLNAAGRTKVTFRAPDNIARFAVRAVVVGDKAAPGVFAEKATHLIVRKSLSLLPAQPRIVRSRDTFNCGVTVTLQDAKFAGEREGGSEW